MYKVAHDQLDNGVGGLDEIDRLYTIPPRT